MPTISAVVVFHRDTPYLRPALASVLGQTWRDLELVLVDNGTGLAPDALGELGRDSRVRWVRLAKNEGIEVGYNAGVAEARGEFLAFSDSDDIVVPNRLERQLAALRNDGSLGAVSSLAQRMDEQDRLSDSYMFTLLRSEELKAYALYDGPLVTGVAMGRREIFSKLPYRPEFPFAGHVDFWARVSEKTRLAVLPEVHLHYRWYPTQTTQTKFDVVEQHRCVIQLITARRRVGRPENVREALQLTVVGDLGQTWRRTACQSLREQFFVLAAYQARRSIGFDRAMAGAFAAGRLAVAAWRHAPVRERGMVAKMFFTGPVRALKLHPA
jgi:hypothetical protein